jgi:hypothetical protein
MFPSKKKLLIAALESGAFPKAMRHLRRNDGFCCLGVACELYRRETGQGQWVPRAHNVQEFVLGDPDERKETYDSGLPPDVREWFGIPATVYDNGFEDEVNIAEEDTVKYADEAISFRSTTSLSNINDKSNTFGPVIEMIKRLPDTPEPEAK